MRHYHQHPIVLVGALIECLLLGGLGVGLALMFGQPLFLGLIGVALLLALWRSVQWAAFSLHVEGRLATLRIWGGFVVNERIVSLNPPGGVRLRQNISGYLLDYGQVRIETFNEPVQIAYITPFSSLKRQIEG